MGLIFGLAFSANAADVCNPRDFQGPYGFQLTGETTVSGDPQPAASLGRLVFDGDGGVSGTSSVKFAGLLLGNPVTGTYEARTDCGVLEPAGRFRRLPAFQRRRDAGRRPRAVQADRSWRRSGGAPGSHSGARM